MAYRCIATVPNPAHCFCGGLKKAAQFRNDVYFHSAHKSFSSGAAGTLKRRSSAAGESFGCALSGTCLSSSARNGSSSRISSAWSCRQISITRFSRSSRAGGNHAVAARRAQPFHGLRSTKLTGRHGALPACAFRSFSRITKNALKHHRHITHQVHRVIVHDDIPGHFDFLSGGFLLSMAGASSVA